MTASTTGLYVRRGVLFASAIAGAVGLYWIGRSFVVDGKLRFGNPVEGAAPLAPEQDRGRAPKAIRAEVTRVVGEPGVRVGDKCEFLVERLAREDGSFYCNAQVTCGDKLLYGGPNRGYFACRIFEGERQDLLGADPNTTAQDQDGAIRLDTRAGLLRVWDDASGPLGAFSVDADVYAVQ